MTKEQLQQLYNFLYRVTTWTPGETDLHDMKQLVVHALAQPQAEPVASTAAPCEHRSAKYNITFTHATCQPCGAEWTASQGWHAAPQAQPAPSDALLAHHDAMVAQAAQPAPSAPEVAEPLTDAKIDAIADVVPVDDLSVHITTWHRRFARAVLAAAPVVREPLTERKPLAQVNRYCSAGMCLRKDNHEAGCTTHDTKGSAHG